MASIRMAGVSKSFSPAEKYRDVHDLNFGIQDGEFFCFIGPTNSGKTEILRLIAGLEKPDSGEILIDDKKANEIESSARRIAMLFETLALYPNKNGFDNIASPLKIRKDTKSQIREHVMEVSKLLKLEHLLSRTPETYSGGEKQRVALARVFVQDAVAFLLDEPLGGLDARLRITMRSELKRIQRDLGQTMVFVSHDQEEVMALGNRIGVLGEGRIQQIGTPQELYDSPRTSYVARTIGKPAMNLYECTLQDEGGRVVAVHEHFRIDVHERLAGRDAPTDREILLGVRPEHIEIEDATVGGDAFPATVFVREPIGSRAIVDFKIKNETFRTVPPADREFEIDTQKWLRIRKERVHLFGKASQQSIV